MRAGGSSTRATTELGTCPRSRASFPTSSREWYALRGSGERKGEAGKHRLYAFLTTEANDVVRH